MKYSPCPQRKWSAIETTVHSQPGFQALAGSVDWHRMFSRKLLFTVSSQAATVRSAKAFGSTGGKPQWMLDAEVEAQQMVRSRGDEGGRGSSNPHDLFESKLMHELKAERVSNTTRMESKLVSSEVCSRVVLI